MPPNQPKNSQLDNTPENEQPKLTVEWGILQYWELTAPTFETQLAREREFNRARTARKRAAEILSNVSSDDLVELSEARIAENRRQLESQERAEVMNGWNANRKLALTYYSEAPIEELLARYHDAELMYSFKELSDGEPYLLSRFFERLCERNPKIQARYDGLRLVATDPNARKQGAKWLKLDELDKVEWIDYVDGFSLEVFSLDGNGEWVADLFHVCMSGNATYMGTLTQYAGQVVPGESGEPQFEVYDPQNPERPSIQYAVRTEVKNVLERFRKGNRS